MLIVFVAMIGFMRPVSMPPGFADTPLTTGEAARVLGRQKDQEFVYAMVEVGLLDPSLLLERLAITDVPGLHARRIASWVQAMAERAAR